VTLKDHFTTRKALILKDWKLCVCECEDVYCRITTEVPFKVVWSHVCSECICKVGNGTRL